MNTILTEKKINSGRFAEIMQSFILLFKNKYFYFSLLVGFMGGALNFASQTYLHNYMSQGKTLPMLSDMILDNLPVINLSLLYDLSCIVIYVVVFIYVIHRNDFNRFPLIILLCGIFFIIRGIFIVLTPFGNPPEFMGSDPLFNGFSKFELGVYPSGHVGCAFLLLLLVNDKTYKYIIAFFLIIIIVSLFLSHGHYSIDMLSGFFFAYAIKAYGDKHLRVFGAGLRVSSVGKPE